VQPLLPFDSLLIRPPLAVRVRFARRLLFQIISKFFALPFLSRNAEIAIEIWASNNRFASATRNLKP